jgi:glycosyltransferase involved in cell wall biosynthesis
MPVGSSWLKLALDAALAPTAAVAALQLRPQVIHAYLHEGALIGWLLARMLRCPLVFDFQGSLSEEMLDHGFISRRSPFLPALRRLERFIDHRPDAVLASSQHASALLTREFGVPSIVVHPLPDSVDAYRFVPPSGAQQSELAALRGSLSIAPEARIVVYLGLLAQYQGIDLLLQAAQLLVNEASHLHAHFLIMGFPFVDRYRRICSAMGLSQHVTFTGRISYDDAPRYLSLGQVGVAPKISTTEGSGKLLNYMAMALPVAAFDTPVHREYLGDLGMYASPGDPRGLADALGTLLSHPADAARRGQGLRRLAIARHSWSRAAGDIEAVYRALLRSSQRGT